MALALGAAAPAAAAPGDLDPTFGGNGRVRTALDAFSNDSGHAMAVQPDGKFVVAGRSGTALAVARVMPDGRVDHTFGGGDGVVLYAVGADDGAQAVGITPRDKIVVAAGGQSTGLVMRLLSDGARDDAFADHGLATVPGFSEISDLAIQDDGAIVVTAGGSDFAVARLTPAGVPDPTFGGDGFVSTDFFGGSDDAAAVAVQDDGKLVVAGRSGNSIALARYETDGGLDPGFSGDGRVITPFGLQAAAADVAVDSSGAIAIAGATGSDPNFLVARYLPGGASDPGFSGDGVAVTDTDAGAANAVAFAPSGRLVAGGSSGGNLALARYKADGSPDAGFGGGLVTLDAGATDEVEDLVVGPAGGVTAVGTATRPDNTQTGEVPDDLLLARFNANGTPNSAFGVGGLAAPALNPRPFDGAEALVVQGDKTVAAGTGPGLGGGSTVFRVVRYLADGTRDPSFGNDGFVSTDLSTGADAATSAVAGPGGTVVVAGSAGGGGLARYRPDGSLDPTFGAGGIVVTPSLPGVVDAAVAPDGSIVVACHSVGSSWIARYEPDGDLDPTFGGGDGMIRIDDPDGDGRDDVAAVAVKPDGGIVATGPFGDLMFVPNVRVESFLPNGNPDPGFGGGDGTTVVVLEGGGDGRDVLTQPDGKIVIATGGHWPLVRLEPDGDLDPTFSGDGIVKALGTKFHYATSLALRDDGTIYAGASLRIDDFLIANFESDGDFDPVFGDQGIVSTDFADGTDTVADVAVDQNDHLIAAGKSERSGQTGTQRAFALARYELGPSGPHFTVSHQTVRENGGPIAIVVGRSSGQGSATVDYATSDVTANAPADYGSRSGTLTFAPGETEKIVNVPIVDDSIAETNERFAITLSNPTGTPIAISTAQVTIEENELPTFTVNDPQASEGAGSLLFKIRRTNAQRSASVVYSTEDGTATAGSDYGPRGAIRLAFGPGQLVRTVSVPVFGDHIHEPNETFFLKLSQPLGATITKPRGVGTIINDD